MYIFETVIPVMHEWSLLLVCIQSELPYSPLPYARI